jgi:hypothetical protein
LLHKNCQTFSTGFRLGEREGMKIGAMLGGDAIEVDQPAEAVDEIGHANFQPSTASQRF